MPLPPRPDDEKPTQSIMDRDCDSNPIRRSTEKRNEEHETSLDRPRNSPLNISALLPPEILGNIFYWTMIFQQSRWKSRQVPHNVLLVCHHWSQVALQTPQLWTSWGDSLEDWERRHASPVVSDLDLELRKDCGYCQAPPTEPLLDALQDRAARDLIQRVSFKQQDSSLLNSIIPAMTTRGEGVQSIGLESFKLRTKFHCNSSVQLSDFFSRYRFPKLQRLLLFGRFELLSWDLLASRTGALVNLSLLRECNSWPNPTPSQLLSILSSNPNLQRLELGREVLPNFDSDEPSFPVELPRLKQIRLSGNSRDVLKLLNLLRPADKLDCLRLCLSYHSTSDISQTLAQFLWDHLRRRGDSEEGLAVGGGCIPGLYSLWVGDAVRSGNHPPSEKAKPFMWVTVPINEGPQEEEEREKLFNDSISHISGRIVYCESHNSFLRSTNLSIGMMNLVEIQVHKPASLSRWFVEPDLGGTCSYDQFLPSLKYLTIFKHNLDAVDWTPLTAFLSRRASVGNRLQSLKITPFCPHICPGVAEEIKRVVQHFVLPFDCDSPCPYGWCAPLPATLSAQLLYKVDQNTIRHRTDERKNSELEAPERLAIIHKNLRLHDEEVTETWERVGAGRTHCS